MHSRCSANGYRFPIVFHVDSGSFVVVTDGQCWPTSRTAGYFPCAIEPVGSAIGAYRDDKQGRKHGRYSLQRSIARQKFQAGLRLVLAWRPRCEMRFPGGIRVQHRSDFPNQPIHQSLPFGSS